MADMSKTETEPSLVELETRFRRDHFMARAPSISTTHISYAAMAGTEGPTYPAGSHAGPLTAGELQTQIEYAKWLATANACWARIWADAMIAASDAAPIGGTADA